MRLGEGLATAAATGVTVLAMAAPALASSSEQADSHEAAMAGMQQVCQVMMQDTPGMDQARAAMMRNPAKAEMCATRC